MPDPREAVYDVLLTKKRRADEARETEERLRESGHTIEAWNDANHRATLAYESKRSR